MERERIGIMGGSFNPIHERHVEMAQCAMKEYKLDRVIFLPTGNPPHKHEELADVAHRYEMTRLAIFGLPGMEPSRMEMEREGTIYTVDTLTLMKKRMGDAQLFYMIGEDTMVDLPNWRKPDKVFSLCQFIVCCRSTEEPKRHPIYEELLQRGAKLRFLSLPPRDVSSTAIRKALAAGEEPVGLSPQVMEYIRMMGLYGVPPCPQGAAQMYSRLRKALTDKRLVHSLLVAWTARQLAEKHGLNPEQAELAGLLHDCAKCLPLSQQQSIAREHRLLLDKETLQSESILHGYAGAALAESEYGVKDVSVLAAIRCHTTGKVGMLPLDMAVYLADKIEPSRRSYPALEEVRTMAETDLLAATIRSLRSTLDYVAQRGGTTHPATRRALEWLERMQREKEKKPIKPNSKRSEMKKQEIWPRPSPESFMTKRP